MAKSRETKRVLCPCGMGRGFGDERQAGKALGRAQTRRRRHADKTGTRRGMRVENRAYECAYGAWHLTEHSRRQYDTYMGVAA